MLWFVAIVAAVIILVLVISYICFRMAFLRKEITDSTDLLPLPEGAEYDPYREKIRSWMEMTRQLPSEEFTITSFDGLKLRGKYFECQPGAPIELMFPGYRGLAERDLCGGIQRCFKLGRNALRVDQRACGRSEGKVISFGINERKDCLRWVDFLIEHFGKDTKIILTGISMGAATVMMASAMELPENVIGIVADCGFTSAKEIIQKVIKDLKLPPKLAYPFVKLGARIYGGFDLEETSAIEAMKHCRVPIFFAHGDADTFVPCQMSLDNYAACTAPKLLLRVPGAAHGLSYPADPAGYLEALQESEKQYRT